jgi:hypothetical protein
MTLDEPAAALDRAACLSLDHLDEAGVAGLCEALLFWAGATRRRAGP